MPRLAYEHKKFSPASLRVISQANAILDDYAAQGFTLTLRQLYYQFVARDLIPNQQKDYKRLGSIVNDARLSGLVDWDAIVDRTRNLAALSHWDDPQEIVTTVARQYRTERWASQPTRVEVWIEKDALVGVIEPVCQRNDVAFFSCRGYTSQSEVWGAAQRLRSYIAAGQNVIVLHLGDHDPSGIDMSRDITDRLRNFIERDWLTEMGAKRATRREIKEDMTKRTGGRDPFEVRRIALNADQVEQYDPPPNPAKITDSRAQGYIAIHGRESWELDALEPSVIAALIEDEIEGLLDHDAWTEATDAMEEQRRALTAASARWVEVVEFLNGQAS